MKNKILCILTIAFISGFAWNTFAQMESGNYSMASPVFSDGGGPVASDNYGINATLGQPTPLMGNVQPGSAQYNHYPGFWYLVSDETLTTTTVSSTTSISSPSTTSTGGAGTTTSTTLPSSTTIGPSSTTSQPTTTTTIIKLKEKAIIVAGGGPEQPMWVAIKNMAEYAYRTLKFQGFSAGNIYYLSAAGSDEWSADYDDKATNDNLQKAIQWGSDADELIVYLTDHGDTGTFRMNDEEILEAEELDSWLDSINAGKMIVFIYEACKSGSFLPLLKPSSGQQRIVMTSVSANEKAKIDPYGLVSFSQYFWAGVLRGEDVCDSFTGGQDSITFQTALLDANGDGVYDAKVDCGLVDDYIIGMGYGTLDDRPTITSVCGDQSLDKETTASIWVDNIVSTGTIVMVWGLVDEPEAAGGGGTGDDIVSLPFVTLEQKSGGTRYEGEYSGFTLQGTYQIAIYAMDESGNISMPITTKVIRSGASVTTTVPPGVTTTTTTLTIPVTVDFMGSPAKGGTPLAVEFFNLSRGEIAGYEWKFGDGQTSTEENPVHTYAKVGTYDVLLTIKGADGSEKYKVKESYIEVTEGTGTVTTTTSTPTTITTTTTTIKFCPARTVAGGDNETLELLRQSRDKVLMTTPAGREYVRLYYKHAEEVALMLQKDYELLVQAEKVLADVMPEIKPIQSRGKRVIKRKMIDAIEALLDLINKNASPSLKEDIELFRKNLNAKNLADIVNIKNW